MGTGKLPLLVVHGGPAIPLDYLEPLQIDAVREALGLDRVHLFGHPLDDRRGRPSNELSKGMGEEAYAQLWGTGGQFRATGKFAGWSVRERLGEIDVPTLVLNGRHDSVTPEIGRCLHEGIANSRFVIFEESGHLAFAEETNATSACSSIPSAGSRHQTRRSPDRRGRRAPGSTVLG